MTYIMVDVAADGPIPGDYSMVCFGAMVVEPALDRTFYGRVKPISGKWIPEALQVSSFTREETLQFDDPKAVMQQFANWIAEVGGGRPMFISDNNGFDELITRPHHRLQRLVISQPVLCAHHDQRRLGQAVAPFTPR
ncbi:MAG: hypothetical protein ABIP48_19800 [Planctomycetota bacterium]